jgi:hypothetical protein|tara:strand:+ start:419 stop:712 length:294 start_codon:yes stop_codon:yes gene_type:complete
MPVMKQIGGVTYIGVSLKDLNKYFKDDAVIHVSKKFLKSYEMISGITEQSKSISMNIIDKTNNTPEPAIAVVKVDTAIEPEREIAPPVDVKESKGDW